MLNGKRIVAALVVLALLLVVFYQHVQLALLRKEAFDSKATFVALHGQVEKRVANGIAEYKKLAPEIGVRDLLHDQQFKTLTADQQAFYKGLRAKGKGLVAAAKVVTIKADSIHKSVAVAESLASTDSTICMVRGDVVVLSDTTKAFKWNALVTVSNPLKLDLRYSYKPTFTTSFERDKATRATVVKFAVNDPDLQVQDIQSIVIPVDERDRTRVGKWLYDRRSVLRAVGAGVIFSVGVAGGALIAR